jgi:hypothetical protein
VKEREQWIEDAVQGSVDVYEALIDLAANYERLIQAQSLTIASLEGVVNDLKAENLELVNHLKLQAAQWSGIVARQRLTIQEQGQTIIELRDQAAGLQEHIKYLNSSPVSPKDLERLRELQDRVAQLEGYTDEELEERNPR